MTETVGGAAFRTVVGGLMKLRRVLLTVVLLDISELQWTNSSVISIDSIWQGVAEASCESVAGSIDPEYREQDRDALQRRRGQR